MIEAAEAIESGYRGAFLMRSTAEAQAVLQNEAEGKRHNWECDAE